MSNIDLRDLILIGHVIRPQGLTGLLRIVSYAESRETFLEAGSLFLDTGQRELQERRIVSIAPHGSAYLLRLAGLNSRNQAECFRAAKLFIREDSLKKDEDEFFYHELLGLDVYLVTGQHLGILREIFPTGSNDVYVVEGQGKEFLIPATHQVVKEINITERKMVISPLKGLLEL